jgi:hypothetical protein
LFATISALRAPTFLGSSDCWSNSSAKEPADPASTADAT